MLFPPSCTQLKLSCGRWGLGVNDGSVLMWDEDGGEAARKVFGKEAQTSPITSSFNHGTAFEYFPTLKSEIYAALMAF